MVPTTHQQGNDSLYGSDLSDLTIQFHVWHSSEACLNFPISIFVNQDKDNQSFSGLS